MMKTETFKWFAKEETNVVSRERKSYASKMYYFH